MVRRAHSTSQRCPLLLERANHVVDESILYATAIGRLFGLEGRGRRVRARLLHIFEFSEDRISRESAWLDVAAMA